MNNQFKSVFFKDPANLVAEAFAELYPNAKYEAALSPEIYDNNGTAVCSCITFPDENEPADAVPIVIVNSQLGVEVAAEALAKELIHVALGPDSLQGGEAYDAALKALTDKYNEIGRERFPDDPTVNKGEGGGGNG